MVSLIIYSLYFQILNVSAIVLANLCVAYIMTSQNEEVSKKIYHFQPNNIAPDTHKNFESKIVNILLSICLGAQKNHLIEMVSDGSFEYPQHMFCLGNNEINF